MKGWILIGLAVALVVPAFAGGEEARRLEVFDVRDLLAGGTSQEELLGQVRAAVGDEVDLKFEKEGVLVVVAAPGFLQDVKEVFRGLRGGAKSLVTIQVRVLHLGGPGEPQVMSAPRLTCFDGEKANVTIASPVSVVRDYEVQTTPDGGTVADPVVESIPEGVYLDMLPRRDAEAGVVRLSLDFRLARVTRPIATEERRIAGATVSLQLPEVRETRLSKPLTIPDGETVLVDAGPDPAGGRVFLEIRAAAIDEATEIGPFPEGDLGLEPK